jgi:cysteine desulfurase
VLQAMGIEREVAGTALRVSLGWNTTAEDIEKFIAAWAKLRARRKAA